MIPPEANGNFVAQMEQVLEVYKRPYDEKNPVICMDEMPKQLIGEYVEPIAMNEHHSKRSDYEYVRKGTCSIFIANEPLKGKRIVSIKERRTKNDWSDFTKTISETYPEAEKITLVMDNLNTHSPGSWYETYSANEAKKLMDRFEIIHTPKHGSWLNMAEIELNVLNGQCLNRRIGDIAIMRLEVAAWVKSRNANTSKIKWQFTSENARIKLQNLYPKL